MFNPWKILGVHRQATDEEVREQYLKLVKKMHPDMRKGDADKCAELNEAYTLLKSKNLRSEFIRQMIVMSKECGSCKGAGATFKQQGFSARIAIACRTCGGSGVIIKQERK